MPTHSHGATQNITYAQIHTQTHIYTHSYSCFLMYTHIVYLHLHIVTRIYTYTVTHTCPPHLFSHSNIRILSPTITRWNYTNNHSHSHHTYTVIGTQPLLTDSDTLPHNHTLTLTSTRTHTILSHTFPRIPTPHTEHRTHNHTWLVSHTHALWPMVSHIATHHDILRHSHTHLPTFTCTHSVATGADTP